MARKRRKLISPASRIRRNGNGKKITRQKVGRFYVLQRAKGLVTSAPPDSPPGYAAVWIDRHDPWAAIMPLAAQREVVTRARFDRLTDASITYEERIKTATSMGVALVPVKSGSVKLVGTSPALARIANQLHHGRRPRRLHRRELIEAIFALPPRRRATAVTQRRLSYAIEYFAEEFGYDLSDLIDHDEVLIGRGVARIAGW